MKYLLVICRLAIDTYTKPLMLFFYKILQSILHWCIESPPCVFQVAYTLLTHETGVPASTPPPPMYITLMGTEASDTTPRAPYLEAAVTYQEDASFSHEARLDIEVRMADCLPVCMQLPELLVCVRSLCVVFDPGLNCMYV